MKKLMIFGLVSLLFVSCKNGSGLFTVEKDLSLKGKKGKSVHFEPGKYEASLNYKVKIFSSNIVELEVDGKKDVIFKLPKGFKASQNHMSHVLKAKEVNQDYDVNIDVNTHYTSSDSYFDKEYCSERLYYNKCIINDSGEKEFIKKSFVVSGQQKVQYHYSYKNKEIVLSLSVPQTGEKVALFDGGETSKSKIYDFKGRCHFKASSKRDFSRVKRDARVCQ